MTAVKNLTVYQFKCSCKTLNQKICILKIVEKKKNRQTGEEIFLLKCLECHFMSLWPSLKHQQPENLFFFFFTEEK